MLAKPFRLPISVNLRGSQSIVCTEFVVKYAKNNLSHARFGFVVGKAVDHRAVARNRIKRVIRSVIEEKWLVEKNVDVLFLVRKGALGKTREELAEKIESALKFLK